MNSETNDSIRKVPTPIIASATSPSVKSSRLKILSKIYLPKTAHKPKKTDYNIVSIVTTTPVTKIALLSFLPKFHTKCSIKY